MGENMTEGSGLSRRGFFKGAALGLAGMMAASQLGGCAQQKSSDLASTGSPEASASSDNFDVERDVEIFDTDLLIVGLGNSGTAAAYSALRDGQRVTVVDKSPYMHGGPTQWAWGLYTARNYPPECYDFLSMVNQVACQNAIDYYNRCYPLDTMDIATYEINHGQVLVSRDENGDLIMPEETSAGVPLFEQYIRREIDTLLSNPNVSFYDNTMLTDVWVKDGVCYGAMGIHVPTGRFRVFRAKATVMASGSCCWMYGIMNSKPVTYNSSDNTGDMQAATYRHGAAIGEAELVSIDFSNFLPRTAFGATVWFDPVTRCEVYDSDGNNIFPDGTPSDNNLNWTIAETVYKGKGGPNGGVYAKYELRDSDDMDFHKIDCNRTLKKYFDFDAEKSDDIECLPEIFDRGGNAVIDGEMMTEISGLFDARGAGMGFCGGASMWNGMTYRIYGNYTGHTAAQYVKSASQSGDVDWQPVLDEYMRLHELRLREDSNGLRPIEIRENLQKTVYTFYGILRETDKIEAAIKEIERIKAEDVPRMVCADKAIQYNREWKEAVETINLIDNAEMAARATLIRDESKRFGTWRPDFPDLNPEWDHMMTECRLVDGQMQVNKVPYMML